MAKTAFIGLGVMGYPMAGHMAARGHDVKVWNRTGEKSVRWREQHGGQAMATPREAAEGSELVMMCVGNDNDVRSVVYGEDGVLAGLKEGSVLVDHTTASAELARELGTACSEKGVGFVDAPVSGGQAGAENGVLSVMCGGAIVDFTRAEGVMQAYGRTITLIGDIGAGQLTKMVNQICIAGLVQGLSEACNFALRAGLDTDKVLGVIAGGAAGSWQMQNRWKTMVEDKFDFGFAVDWMRKDLRICLEEARNNGAALPVTALVDQFYRQVQQQGGGRWDTSSLLRNLTVKD
ncbi:MAG: NAD(P)-dependent oxidoreductase [Geminicoccaceae bacterium]|nr:NAD(P)-dependent oxidoreductase [Geminicoccaceae bacterium]